MKQNKKNLSRRRRDSHLPAATTVLIVLNKRFKAFGVPDFNTIYMCFYVAHTFTHNAHIGLQRAAHTPINTHFYVEN